MTKSHKIEFAESNKTYTPDNTLNVFTYGWYPWRYPSNWFKNIKWFFRLVRFAYQRVKYGYCDYDVWDLDTYYANLMHNSLKSLSATTHSHPADRSYEDWQAQLEDAANLLHSSIEDNGPWENPYEDEAVKLFDKWTTEPCGDGCSRLVMNYTPEEEALNEKFLARDREIAQLRSIAKDQALDWLKANWYSLWD